MLLLLENSSNNYKNGTLNHNYFTMQL